MKSSALRHIAFIPDGNRRWARERSLIPWKGHEKSAGQFFEIAESAFKSGISYVTLWAASVDNLTKRSTIEIKFLCSLLRRTLESKETIARLMDNHIRLRIIGEYKQLIHDAKLILVIDQREKDTMMFTERHLTILFGYDGKQEMKEAIRALCKNPDVAIMDQTVQAHLWTADLPPVDLVVRTGGEPHWSAGFMMWHTADSQFYFTEKLWPDFGIKELQDACDDYARRERRFGK